MWVTLLINALSAVPYIVAGIEKIHGDSKSGAQKKQLAMEALGLASTSASVIDPAQATTINAASTLVSQTIDGVVSVMKTATPTQPTGARVANFKVLLKG